MVATRGTVDCVLPSLDHRFCLAAEARLASIDQKIGGDHEAGSRAQSGRDDAAIMATNTR
jgi:hypothetical protein